MRKSLMTLVGVEERFMDMRALLVAAFLDQEADGAAIALYGCGALARKLVDEHRACLERLDVIFLESRLDEMQTFLGFPKRTAASILADPPGIIMLLSGSFEASMLRELSRVDRELIFTLGQVVEKMAGDAEIKSIAAILEEEAESVRVEVEPIFRGHTKTICFVASNFGIETIDRFRKVREAGYKVAILIAKNAHLPKDRAAMVSEGYADYFYLGASYVGLLHLVSMLLRRTDAFKLVHAWTTLEIHIFLEDWINHGHTKVVPACDDFFPSFFEHQQSIDNICCAAGVPFERLDHACKIIYRQAAGVLYKDSPKIFEDFRSRYQTEPTRHHYYLPEIVNCQTGGVVEKYSDRDGEIHIVYGQSLHKNSIFSFVFDLQGVLREIKAITSQKIHFTIFNALDPDGTDYQEFVDLDRLNPYFHYCFRLPFLEYISEIRKYDFGWIGSDPAMCNKLPTRFRHNMQLKILGYAQAGLPTLVAPHLEFCSELIEAEGIGITIADTQWPELHTLLALYDLPQARIRLDAFCRKLDIEKHVPEMTAFFDSLIS
jgi:hypothetical protein